MIHLGLGSLPDKSFRGVTYSSNYIEFYNDQNYTHYSDAHPQLPGVFFQDKGIQPSNDFCLGSIAKENHGKITPETMFRDMAGYHSTGDATVVVMDPEGQQIWASWSQYNTLPLVYAYQRSPIHIDLSKYWGTKDKAQFLQ